MQYLKALIMVELTPYQALTYLATLSAYLKACSEAESLSSLIRVQRAKHTGDALQSSPRKRDSKSFLSLLLSSKRNATGFVSTSVPSIFPIIHKKIAPVWRGVVKGVLSSAKKGPSIGRKDPF